MVEINHNAWPSEEFEYQCPNFMQRAISPVTPEQVRQMRMEGVDLTEGLDRAEARINGSPDEKERLRDELHKFMMDTVLHGKQDEGDYI